MRAVPTSHRFTVDTLDCADDARASPTARARASRPGPARTPSRQSHWRFRRAPPIRHRRSTRHRRARARARSGGPLAVDRSFSRARAATARRRAAAFLPHFLAARRRRPRGGLVTERARCPYSGCRRRFLCVQTIMPIIDAAGVLRRSKKRTPKTDSRAVLQNAHNGRGSLPGAQSIVKAGTFFSSRRGFCLSSDTG